MRNNDRHIANGMLNVSYLIPLVLLVLVMGTSLRGQKQAPKVRNSSATTEEARALYKEYRGVRLGMTTPEVRAKLGEPKFGDAEMDFYVISETETTQIAYDKAHKVKIISTDYIDGLGAPDYVSVCGSQIVQKPDGSLYQMLTYEKEGFWASYNKSASGLVTVTIQVLMK